MQGLNFRLAFAIAAGAFGSAFQHGYNTGVLNAPQTLVMDWMMNCTMTQAEEGKEAEKVCVMTEEEGVLIWSWIVATFCVGGIIGGSAVGAVASGLGRFVYFFSVFETVPIFSDTLVFAGKVDFS